MALCLLKNKNATPFSMPRPYRGVVPGGGTGAIVLTDTAANVIANLGGTSAVLHSGLEVLDLTTTPPADTFYDGGAAQAGDGLSVSGNLVTSGNITTTGDLSAAGGYRMPVAPFYGADRAASTAQGDLTYAVSGGGSSTTFTQFIATRAGSIMGLWVKLSANAAGSPLNIQATVNGTKAAASNVTIGVGAATGRATFAKDTAGLTFAAGDLIGIATITDGSWTGTAIDIVAGLEIEQ